MPLERSAVRDVAALTVLRVLLYLGAAGGWLCWLLLFHVWTWTSTGYIGWLPLP